MSTLITWLPKFSRALALTFLNLMNLMPIRRETHPVVHFLEFHPRFTALHGMKLSVFRNKLSNHVARYAVDAAVRRRHASTAWDYGFYGWVFRVYRVRISRSRGGIWRVFVDGR